MVWMNVKHIKRVRSKGRVYHYHQVTGERLSDDPDERIERVVEINAGLGKPTRPREGTLAAVATEYRKSPEYKSLRPKTQKDYLRYLDLLCERWGAFSVTGIRRKHVLALRDQLGDTPATANTAVKVLRVLLAFAVDREYRQDNPAKGIKKLTTGPGYSAWPDWAIERFLETAPPMMVLAMKLGLHTGQREADVLGMSWHNIDGGMIHVVQGKTGAKLAIPMHSDLRDALERQERVSPMILTTETGKPYRGSNFRYHWVKAMKAAGLEGMTFHGLRYTAATKLAEAGCSLKEIAAITGHRSLAMLEKYSRGADQQKLARAAIRRLERNTDRTKTGKLPR